MGKRRLEDLYVVGKSVTIDDGQGDPEEVWIQKLFPFQAEKALRVANAKRSTVLALQKSRSSEEFAELTSEVFEKSQDQLIDEIAAEEIYKRSEVIEAEISASPEWTTGKDHPKPDENGNYLTGLKEAWGDISDEDSLSRKYLDDPEDLEAKQVFSEFERLAEEVNARLEVDKQGILNKYRNKTLEELQDIWIDKHLESEADQVWFKEFRKQEVFYATRQADDHKKYYFPTRESVDYLDSQVWLILLTAYLEVSVDIREGKDLAPKESSLPEPESQESPETEASSGLTAANL